MEKLLCFTSGSHSSPLSCVPLPPFLINVSFSTSTPITVSPAPRRTRCPACRSLFPRTERSSSLSRCRLMTAAQRGWASASKETSPGRRGRTWGSSSNPLSTEVLRTRWPNIVRRTQMSKDKHSRHNKNCLSGKCKGNMSQRTAKARFIGRQEHVESVRGSHRWSWRVCSGFWSAAPNICKQKKIITCDIVMPFICAFAGRTFVHQRPAGGGKRRVAAGMLQPSGHGDTSPLHVPGGER